MASHLNLEWEIHAVDLRGHGESDPATGYRVEDYVRDVVDILPRITSGPVVMVGHSLGAMVAACTAARTPERVRALVLEDPPFVSMGPAIVGSHWQALFRGMREVCRRDGSIEERTHRLGEVLLPQSDGTSRPLRSLRDPEALRWSTQCLSRLDPTVLDPLVEGRWMDGIDWQDVARSIRCPTVLLQGDVEAGGALADGEADAFAAACTRLEHLRFPGFGHQLHGTLPERVAAIVDRFRG